MQVCKDANASVGDLATQGCLDVCNFIEPQKHLYAFVSNAADTTNGQAAKMFDFSDDLAGLVREGFAQAQIHFA